MKIAQGKFVESGESVEKMTSDIKGRTILVPLTGSMYVPGTIADTDSVIIDIGTGYYAQKVRTNNQLILERVIVKTQNMFNEHMSGNQVDFCLIIL